MLVWLLPQFRVKGLGKGVFRTFPRSKKKCGGRWAPEFEGARALELIHAGGKCGAHGFRRVGAAQ